MVSENLKSSSQRQAQDSASQQRIQLPGESMQLNPPRLHPTQVLRGGAQPEKLSLPVQPHQSPRSSVRRKVVSSHPSGTRSTQAQIPEPGPKTTGPKTTKRTPSSHLGIGTLQPRQTRSSWNWPIVWIAVIGFFGTMGAIAFQWLTQLPPAPNCEQISPLTSDSERLFCAQQAADTDDLDSLLKAMSLIGKWTPDHPLYDEAQSMLEDWSTALLAIARTKTNQSSLNAAIEIVNHIPTSSPVYEEAQAEVAQWKEQWQRGDAIYQLAIAAIKTQDWDRASEQITALDKLEFDYWRQNRANDLTSRILTEKQAWQDLKQAETIVGDRQPNQLTQAIDLVHKINPQTEAWNMAEPLLKDWSQQLTAASLAQLSQGKVDAALSLAQHLPPDPELTPGGFDLVQMSRAQALAASTKVQWEPTLQSLWHLFLSVNIAQQIEPNSQFHDQAQTQSADWAAQFQDLIDLQFATWTASLGHEFALKLAIDQANQIGLDRPRRLQAQTLAAHWGQEIQRIEDRPLLAYARRLAEPGKLDDFRAAIQYVNRIPTNRALRPEAEVAIANWTEKIQILEDQPILDAAQRLADQGQLANAIQEAEKIAANRALYDDARTKIQTWQNQINLARDRKLLADATALASRDRLTEAINLASQISPGGALYQEAQSAIGQWQARRSEIWESWRVQDANRSEAPAPTYTPPDESNEPTSSSSYEGYYDSRYYDEYYGY